MKVLHVFKDYYPPTHGGIEQHIHDIVHSLEGFEFAVLTSSRSRRLDVGSDFGVRVIRAPEYARPTSTPITPKWSKLLRKAGADLIHFHMPNPFGELAVLSSRTWIPMIASYHADIVGREALLPFFRPFQKRFLRKAQKIVVSNPRIPETSDALKPHAGRVIVIPYGVDPDEWVERPPLSDDIRAKYEGPLILFLGRLAHYKGVDVLIEAIERVDGTLLIVGDGPLRADLEATAANHRVRRKVKFIGEVDNSQRAAYFHAADVFVLPGTSRAEAFGIVLLEAMACGTPVVSTELGTGTSWVNKDLETGLVVPPRDPPALAGAIKAILSDDAKRAAMVSAAIKRVREKFTKKQMLDALGDLYRSF